MYRIPTCFFLLFLYVCSYAQVFVYELGADIEAHVSAGADCLKAGQDSCDLHFQRAVKLARQQERDSLLAMTYFEICTAFDYYGSEEERVRYAQEGLRLDGRQHPTLTNRLYRELGSSFRRMGTLDSVMPAYHKAMEWARYSRDNSTIAVTYITMGGALKRLGRFKEAIEVLLEGEAYARASGDPHRINGILFNLATTYYANDDLELAIEKYEQAAAGFLDNGDSVMYVRAVANRAGAAIEVGDPQYAIEELPAVITYFRRQDPNAVVYPTAQYAKALVNTEAYEQALPILTQNLEQCQKINNTYIALLCEKLLSICHLELGQPAQALQHARRAYLAEKQNGLSNGYLSALKQYARALEANRQFEQALEVQREFVTVNDSIFSQAKMKEIAALQEQYEAVQRENQIELLENEVRLGTLQRLMLILGLGALAIILALVYVQYRERHRRAQQEQARLQQELSQKKKELTTHVLQLAKRNERLREMKAQLKGLHSPEHASDHRALIRSIDMDLKDENHWQEFIQHFEAVHPGFNGDMQQRFPGITPNELRLLALFKMNLSSKEIASLLNITQAGVKKARHRLRKKLGLRAEQSLEELVFSL